MAGMPDLIDQLTERASRHPVFHRYVALGDSFTEGVGDPDPRRPNGWRGWADLVAEVLATRTEDFGYANLAIRGRKLPQILAEQVEPARALRPDLVSIYAGGNDILRPKVDIDGLVAAYANAVGRLRSSGAHLVLFTGFDLGFAPVFRHLRGRVAVYNELVREVSDEHGATLVDFWRLREFRDPRLWDADRMHLSSAGHERMAHAVLDALGVEHDRTLGELARARHLTRREQRAENLDWARSHLAPWVKRRVQGSSSGDGVSPKHPELIRPTLAVPPREPRRAESFETSRS
jgi:lysophospholipase L1-like esterase